MKLLTVLILSASISLGFSSTAYAAHQQQFRHGHVVHALPAPWHVVKVRGIPYYVHKGYYYRRYHNRYIAVPVPIVEIAGVFPGGYITYRARFPYW